MKAGFDIYTFDDEMRDRVTSHSKKNRITISHTRWDRAGTSYTVLCVLHRLLHQLIDPP